MKIRRLNKVEKRMIKDSFFVHILLVTCKKFGKYDLIFDYYHLQIYDGKEAVITLSL